MNLNDLMFNETLSKINDSLRRVPKRDISEYGLGFIDFGNLRSKYIKEFGASEEDIEIFDKGVSAVYEQIEDLDGVGVFIDGISTIEDGNVVYLNIWFTTLYNHVTVKSKLPEGDEVSQFVERNYMALKQLDEMDPEIMDFIETLKDVLADVENIFWTKESVEDVITKFAMFNSVGLKLWEKKK